ncbi:carbon-nitrogen hydrolase [Cladochytrium replicatum]|nr:carbon-nitrogen hydrolase [Cladochytrium replicatum]
MGIFVSQGAARAVLLAALIVAQALGSGLQPVQIFGWLFYPLAIISLRTIPVPDTPENSRFFKLDVATLIGALFVGLWAAHIKVLVRVDDGTAFPYLMSFLYTLAVSIVVLPAYFVDRILFVSARTAAAVAVGSAGRAAKEKGPENSDYVEEDDYNEYDIPASDSVWVQTRGHVLLNAKVVVKTVNKTISGFATSQLFVQLAFPTVLVALWKLWTLLGPIGSYGHPAYVNIVGDVRQFASVFGIDGLLFIMAWFGTASAELLGIGVGGFPILEKTSEEYTSNIVEDDDDDIEAGEILGSGSNVDDSAPLLFSRGIEAAAGAPSAKLGPLNLHIPTAQAVLYSIISPETHAPLPSTRRATNVFWLTLLIVVCMSGVRPMLQNGSWFQRPIGSQYGTVYSSDVRVGCVYNADPSRFTDDLFNRTKALVSGSPKDPTGKRVITRPQVVFWSETALYVDAQKGLDVKLIEEAKDLARALDIYLGVSYFSAFSNLKEKKHSDGNVTVVTPSNPHRNMFTLIDPRGRVILNHQKAHLMPIFDHGFQRAKHGTVSTAETDLLSTVGASIGFELDLPDFMNAAGEKTVEVLLQPSRSWGAVGLYQARSSALRAVEQGFALVRCSSNGISGVYGPFGETVEEHSTVDKGEIVMTVPVRITKVRTVYSDVKGWLFGWGILLLALFVTGWVAGVELWAKHGVKKY